MRRLVALTGVLLVLAGALVTAPLALARWRYASARAVITDVFLQPCGDGNVRLLVAFEFLAPGTSTTWCSLAGNQADARLRRVPDPVMPLAQAQVRARTLLGNDPRWRQSCTVYYPPQEPADAVMVGAGAGASARAYDVGLALVACGMLTIVLSRRSLRSDP